MSAPVPRNFDAENADNLEDVCMIDPLPEAQCSS